MALEDALGFELSEPLAPRLLESAAACEARWQAISAEHGGVAAFAAPDGAALRELATCGVGAADRRAAWVAWCGGGGAAEAPAREAEYARALSEPPAAEAQALARSADRAQIGLDLMRTFPDHAAFRPGGLGLAPLERLLTATSASTGSYVQGQNFMAAFCLLALDDGGSLRTPGTCTAALEADCACVLRSLLSRLRAYYAPGMAALRADLAAVAGGLRWRAPDAHARLQALDLDATALLPRWLLCAFVGTVPSCVALRAWDGLLAAPACHARRSCRRMAAALLAGRGAELAVAEDAGAAAAVLRAAGAATQDACVLLRAALAPASAGAPEDATPPPPPSPRRRPLARRNDVTPAASRKRGAAALDAGALFTPLGNAVLRASAVVAQSPMLIANALGALTGQQSARRSEAATPVPASAAKRARLDGHSPLPAWQEATPVRATPVRATPMRADAEAEAEMELAAMRPRRLATTPVRAMR